MKQRWIGILLALLLIFSLTACKDANNAAQSLPTAGNGGKLSEISKAETGDMDRDGSESSAVPDGEPDMVPPSDKEAAAVSIGGSGAEYPASEQAFERLRETEIPDFSMYRWICLSWVRTEASQARSSATS